MNEEKIEELADKQHKIWSHWMKYFFSLTNMTSYDTIGGEKMAVLYIKKDHIDRWQKQMKTNYKNLTEKEKESDRNIVRDFILK